MYCVKLNQIAKLCVNDLKISLLAVNFLLVSENVEHFLSKPAFFLQRVLSLGQGLGSARLISGSSDSRFWGLLFKILNFQQNIHQPRSSEIMNQKLQSHMPFNHFCSAGLKSFLNLDSDIQQWECVMFVYQSTLSVWDHTCGSLTPAPAAGLKLPLSPHPGLSQLRPLTTRIVARKRGNRESTTLSITDLTQV